MRLNTLINLFLPTNATPTRAVAVRAGWRKAGEVDRGVTRADVVAGYVRRDAARHARSLNIRSPDVYKI